MKKTFISILCAAMLLSVLVLPGAALAKDNDDDHGNHGKENIKKQLGDDDNWEYILKQFKDEGWKSFKDFWEKKKDNKHNEKKKDGDRVAADKAAIRIDFGGNDTADSVTRPLDSLPTKGALGSTISWVSSNPAILSNDGKTLNRPKNGTGDVKITLTATISYKSAKDTKKFVLTIKNRWNDAQIVAADKAALTISFSGNDNSGSVTGPITLPVKGANGSAITWISANPSVISNDGKTVNRQANSDVSVALTAIIKSNNASDYKKFTLIVKRQFNDAQKLAADKAALEIQFTGSDNAGSVTGPIKLPVKGANGSTIKWISSVPSIISNDGLTVNLPAAATKVVMTAVLKLNNVSDAKQFTLVVKPQPQIDAQKLAADKAALEIQFTGSDNAGSVTGPIKLPAKGVNGSTIKWISSVPSIISNDGLTVKLPAAATKVVMTAVLTLNNVSDAKQFTLVVKPQPQTDAQKLAADKAALAISFRSGDSASSVTKSLVLPVTGANGSTILWISSDTSFISDDGKTVNRPPSGTTDAAVTLTAILLNNGESDYKTFDLIVKHR